MDDDTADLVRLLCTRAGMIMEDASPMAIMVGGKASGELCAIIEKLQAQIRRVNALLTAAQGLISSAASASCNQELPGG